jgi:LacI family transcriptional regulator
MNYEILSFSNIHINLLNFERETMTSKELAKILGVSPAAVSLALNGKSGISTKTRNRIREAALQYGFDEDKIVVPEEHKDTLFFIGYDKKPEVLMNQNAFYEIMIEGVQKTCNVYDICLNTAVVYSKKQLKEQIQIAENEKVMGIILLATIMQTDEFELLNRLKIPVVLVDNHYPGSELNSIVVNNIDGAYVAAKYLINKFKEIPGYLKSSVSLQNFTERNVGFDLALMQAGYSKNNYPVYRISPGIKDAYYDMLEILDENNRIPRSFFAENDLIAIGTIQALREKGYRVPEDVAVMGFDDLPVADMEDLKLTTMQVPKLYMGKAAVERLIQIARGKDDAVTEIRVNTYFISRNTA